MRGPKDDIIQGSDYDEDGSLLDVDHAILKDLPLERLTEELVNKPDHIAIRFASGICGHFIEFDQTKGQFQAVYGGPHGPENRPAQVNLRNLRILQDECEHIEVIPHEKSPFGSVEVKDV